MTTVSIEDARFVDRKINDRYTVKMPQFLATHDSFNNWERERFASMESLLKPGDILFDVGAETGHISAVYASFVGAENMVLFESNPDNWQNIKATWNAMGLATPLGTVNSLVSEQTVTVKPEPRIFMGHWPDCALTGQVWVPRSYRYIHEHAHNTNQISIDDFCEMTTAKPDAITIDVEGAEYSVLSGARKTLQRDHPFVWASLHPDLMLRDYRRTVSDVHEFMERCGYGEEYLATDHEVHMLYRPR